MELDGRKMFPINHGPVAQLAQPREQQGEEAGAAAGEDSPFLRGCVAVIQEQFMRPDPEELRFTFIALSATPAEPQEPQES